jgi:hypothetical protein
VRTETTIGVAKFAVAKPVQGIKAGSSAWIDQPFQTCFAWPRGYGKLSVDISQVQETVHYIEQQLEHRTTDLKKSI